MSELFKILTEATGLSHHTIMRVISTAPRRYRVYKIRKRRGGFREIAQPAKEVKALQRALTLHFLSSLPVHPAAMAYEPGVSIRKNAATHAPNGPILKFDLVEFFPSIRARDWHKYCDEHGLFMVQEERWAVTKILFHQPKGTSVLRLAIGAPSSPHLSNLLMYEFDRQIAEAVGTDFVTYTRYADDLTFSAKRTGFLTGVEKTVRKALHSLSYPKLRINEAKTVLATVKFHRQVTGLVLTNDGRVSLGRERKRLLRARLHHFTLGKLNPKEAQSLKGYMAFVRDVEPEFYARMEVVYGKEALEALDSLPRPPAWKK